MYANCSVKTTDLLEVCEKESFPKGSKTLKIIKKRETEDLETEKADTPILLVTTKAS